MKTLVTHRRGWVLLVSGLLLAGLLAACAPANSLGACPPDCPYTFNTPSTFAPSSEEADRIRTLFFVILGLSAFVFVVVEGILVYTVFKFRNRPPESAVQIHGNTRLEIAWTTAPAVILAVLFGFTLQTMIAVKGPATGEVLHVKAIGHQYWWEFQYPSLDITTAGELIAPVGTTIEVELSSVDVEHGLWAPELFGKVDAIPGYVTRLRFTPTQAGTHEYGGQCTQFCGTQHAQMRFSVIAMSRYDFNEWAFQNAKPAAEPTGNAAKGMEVFNAKCIACHTINGNAKAVGKVGPNLTHVASRHFIAGGVLDIDVDNKAAVFAQWLSDPQGVKPGNKMVVQLTDAEVNDLVAYLLTLK